LLIGEGAGLIVFPQCDDYYPAILSALLRTIGCGADKLFLRMYWRVVILRPLYWPPGTMNSREPSLIHPMRKPPPQMRAAADNAETERKRCREWLLSLTRISPRKTRTKADLRAEAMACFGISRNSFDYAWIEAIEETGNRHWYEPLRPPR
jgi:hypothetical protein